jgi:hypothetical protein
MGKGFMSRRLALLLTLAAMPVLGSTSSAWAFEQVHDGGFEQTVCPQPGDHGYNCTNPSWIEVGTQAFVCAGTTGACTPQQASGLGWGELGLDPIGAGYSNPNCAPLLCPTIETGALVQFLEIPNGPATLSFSMKIVPESAEADFSVSVDGTDVLTAAHDTPGYATYTKVTRDVSAMAGAGTHELKFGIVCFNDTSGEAICPALHFDDVSLTTPSAGQASHCTVPAVRRGSKLGAVKAVLSGGGCTVGKTTRHHSAKVKRGRLIRLKIAAGTVLGAGAAVDVVLSKGPR